MKDSSKVMTAAALGVLAGSALGLLFAPEKGIETRKKLSLKGKDFLNTLKENAGRKKLTKAKEKLEFALQKINEKLEGPAVAEPAAS